MSEPLTGIVFTPQGETRPIEGKLVVTDEGQKTFQTFTPVKFGKGTKLTIHAYRKEIENICELDFSFVGDFEGEVISETALEIIRELKTAVASPIIHVQENAEASKRFVESFNKRFSADLFEHLKTAFLVVQGGKIPIIEKITVNWNADTLVLQPENPERTMDHLLYNHHAKIFIEEYKGIENIEILGTIHNIKSREIFFIPNKVSYGKHTEMETTHISQNKIKLLVEEARGIEGQIKLWWRITRGHLAVFGIMSAALGVALLTSTGSIVNRDAVAKIFMMIMAFLLASNLLNDYFDSIKDEFNPFAGPLHGGSGAIQHDLITREQSLMLSLILGAIGSLVALDLLLERWDPLIFLLGLIAVVIAVLFSAPPFRIGSSGVGEISLSLEIGVLPLMGTYLYLAGSPHFTSDLFMVAGMLFLFLFSWFLLSNIMDFIPDVRAEKHTLAVIIGQKRALLLFRIVFGMATLIWGFLLIVDMFELGVFVAVAGGILAFRTITSLKIPLHNSETLIENTFKTMLIQLFLLIGFILF